MSTTQEQYWSLAKTKQWLMNQISKNTRARNITEMKIGISSCLRHFPALSDEGKPRFNIDQRIDKKKYKNFTDAKWKVTLESEAVYDDLAGGMKNLWGYKAIFTTEDNLEGIPQKFVTKSYSKVKYLKQVVIRRIIDNNRMLNVYSPFNICHNNKNENIGYMGW